VASKNTEMRIVPELMEYYITETRTPGQRNRMTVKRYRESLGSCEGLTVPGFQTQSGLPIGLHPSS
jgi:hypothetical protein